MSNSPGTAGARSADEDDAPDRGEADVLADDDAALLVLRGRRLHPSWAAFGVTDDRVGYGVPAAEQSSNVPHGSDRDEASLERLSANRAQPIADAL